MKKKILLKIDNRKGARCIRCGILKREVKKLDSQGWCYVGYGKTYKRHLFKNIK